MISWIVIVCGLAASFYYSDLHSDDTTYSVVAPVLFMCFGIAFLLKLVLNYKWARQQDSSSFGDGGGSYGGGDGGGGDGGE